MNHKFTAGARRLGTKIDDWTGRPCERCKGTGEFGDRHCNACAGTGDEYGRVCEAKDVPAEVLPTIRDY